MKRIVVFTIFFAVIISGIYFLKVRPSPKPENHDFADTRSEVLSDLDAAIASAVDTGDYHCCISPPCTMCYLGSWTFEDGKCNCDAMIAKGELDKVCPECKKGVESGTCSSQVEAADSCAAGF